VILAENFNLNIKDMTKIRFIEKDGNQKDVEAPIGLSVLEIAHKNNIDLEGACEGSLACSTCHVIVDKDWYNVLPKANEDEEDMLDLAFGLTPTSRLGCQIIIRDNIIDKDTLFTCSLPNQTRNFKG
jgi:2Fe-2S ferredoxin